MDHYDANRILAAEFLLWSLATATTGLVWGFFLLLSTRLAEAELTYGRQLFTSVSGTPATSTRLSTC